MSGAVERVRWGHDSNEPCIVCVGRKNNQSEPRLGYTCCEVHRHVPPTSLLRAGRQYEALGFTDWDDPT